MSIPAMSRETPASERMRSPLIIGASVSAGFGTLSPGDRLSRRFTSPQHIRNVARSGRPARDHLPLLQPDLLRDRTIVIAMDYLFWDSTLPDIGPSVRALDRLMELANARGIPLVLGDIPALLPSLQTQRVTLNEIIHKKCRNESHCHLLRLDELHQKVKRDGYLEIKAKRYTFSELVPDGLHLVEVASEFLADYIYALPVT
ncbi:MAG: SGNH/GDSL hydrolase family protein [Bdellovibrionales bacterium]